MGVQHIVDVAVQLRWRALIARLELGAEIGPFFTSKRHQAAAEGLLRALIALQAGDKIVVRRGVRKTCCIQRRLGDPRADMGPCHEGGIAEQRHAPEHGLRRFEIEDRLEERLRRAGEDFGDLRRDEGPRRCLDRGGDLGTDQRRRDRGAVAPAGRVGAEVDQRRIAVGGSVPDDVVGAAAGLGLVVAAGNGIGEEQLAVRQTERIALENLRPDLRRHVALIQHRAPGDVAGVIRFDIRQELLAHGGAHTIGAH